jgi:hypothetical protein
MLPALEKYFEFDEHWTTSAAEARTTLAAALVVLGDVDSASRLYGPLKEWTSAAGYVLTGASTIPQLVSRVLGMTAGAIGAKDEAAAHFERAVELAGDMALDAELAECHYWYARHLLSGGDESRADGLAHLDRAVGVWQAAEMESQITRAEALRGSA